MREFDTPPPQPPVPRSWSKIIGLVVVVALVVAYFAIPSVRNSVISVGGITIGFFKKILGL
jgi:hypothetical protein